MQKKTKFQAIHATYFLRAAPGYDHLLHLILESVPESRFTGVSLRVFEATVRSNLRAENIRSWKKYWKINSFWWRHVIVLARCIAGKCDVLWDRLLLLLTPLCVRSSPIPHFLHLILTESRPCMSWEYIKTQFIRRHVDTKLNYSGSHVTLFHWVPADVRYY